MISMASGGMRLQQEADQKCAIKQPRTNQAGAHGCTPWLSPAHAGTAAGSRQPAARHCRNTPLQESVPSKQCAAAAAPCIATLAHQSASTSCSSRMRSLFACLPGAPCSSLLPPSLELKPGGCAGRGPQPCASPAAALAPLPPLAVDGWAGTPPPEGGCGSHSGAEFGTFGSDCTDCIAGSCGRQVGRRGLAGLELNTGLHAQ